MEAPPLTLSLLRLTPSSLLISDQDDLPTPFPLPPTPAPIPPPPPDIFSPTHSYPSPYPTISLGSTLGISLELRNSRREGVLGVRMMCEVQGPGGRYRLGEIVHGQKAEDKDQDTGVGENGSGGVATLPELPEGECIEMDVEGDIKEVGLHIIIVSVAWETLEGRRTFQRFFKFNVNPPLAIKTRILNSQHPNTSLNPVKRDQIYLEVLAQNVSSEGLVFDKVVLEPVHGLSVATLSSLRTLSSGTMMDENNENAAPGVEKDGTTLMPGDTRQYLFVLFPTFNTSSENTTSGTAPLRKSTFPPYHVPRTILPLGRLDLSWRSGPSHDPGRLQTATLNRRIPIPNPNSTVPPPTRTVSAAPPSPAGSARIESTRPPVPPKTRNEDADRPEWECDLVVLDMKPHDVAAESTFEVVLRVGARTTPVDDLSLVTPPIPPRLGVQYLTRNVRANMPPSLGISGPNVAVSPPIGPTTPMTRASSTVSNAAPRPFSPLSSSTTERIIAASSRPMTPVSSQLRQATSSSITSSSTILPLVPAPSTNIPTISILFPPPPAIDFSASSAKHQSDQIGEIAHLGVSLQVLSPEKVELVEDNVETTYTDPIVPAKRWEVTQEVKLKFVALQPGMVEIGGMRVLILDDEGGLKGRIGREWESVGDICIAE